MGEPELRVDVQALTWDPAEVTVPPVPAIPPGADPMSVMIAAIMPEIATAVAEGIAEARAREERFSTNVTGARNAYQNTDGAAQQAIQGAGAAIEPGSAGAGSPQAAGSPAGQAGQLGQLMGMPMQMAGQAAQLPMQMMGMAAAIPQAIMQGVQAAMQQMGQASGTGDTGDQDAEKNEELLSAPTEGKPEEGRTARHDEPAAETGQRDRASGAERVPPPDQPAMPSAPAVPRPAPTRPAESPETML
jgi:PE family